jgi:hypothetical protein
MGLASLTLAGAGEGWGEDGTGRAGRERLGSLALAVAGAMARERAAGLAALTLAGAGALARRSRKVSELAIAGAEMGWG